MRAVTLIALAAVAMAIVAPTSVAAVKGCHNITGTCLDHGFVCANEEVVPHSKRCDGVDDCADGTDEFMCHHENDKPLHLQTEQERHAVEQGSCGKCTCQASVQTITTTSAWFTYAKVAPTDFLGLMTGTGSYKGMPCRADCVSSIVIGFYRKAGICRGGLCCARQRECLACANCGGANAVAKRCWAP